VRKVWKTQVISRPQETRLQNKRIGACLIAVGYRLVLPLVSSFSSLGSRGGVVLPMMVTRLQSTNQVEMFSRIFGVMSPPVWVSRHLRTSYGTAGGRS
jgi:hypothetical protein